MDDNKKSSPVGSQEAYPKKSQQGNIEAIEKHRLWQKNWWKKTHKLCLRCVNECKQSTNAKIIICPQFKEKA